MELWLIWLAVLLAADTFAAGKSVNQTSRIIIIKTRLAVALAAALALAVAVAVAAAGIGYSVSFTALRCSRPDPISIGSQARLSRSCRICRLAPLAGRPARATMQRVDDLYQMSHTGPDWPEIGAAAGAAGTN